MDLQNIQNIHLDRKRVRAIKNQVLRKIRAARFLGAMDRCYWIWNFLRVTGNPERIQELKERANLNGRVFNFEAFVPMDGKDFREYPGGRSGWMLKHWGTEQNARCGIIKEDEPDSILYAFKTIGISRKVFGVLKDFYPELKIEERYGCYPVKVAQRLKVLYPDLDIDWSCQPIRDGGKTYQCFNEDDIALEEYDEHGGLKYHTFENFITMDDENIRKFKNLYGKSCFSFSMIIRESPDENISENGVVRIRKYRDSEEIESRLAEWRYENWGTPSDAHGKHEAEDVLNGKNSFGTDALPPFKIYRKMAEDGLVFKIKWKSKSCSRWAHGSGQVVDGRFQYKKAMMMGKEEKAVNEKVEELFRRIPHEKPSLIVRNREHLDELVACLQRRIKKKVDSFLWDWENHQDVSKKARDEIGGFDISYVEKNVFQLNKTLDLNFLDVSRVTDMSYLFKGFDCLVDHDWWYQNLFARERLWEMGKPFECRKPHKYRCQIKLDISRWDVSNVTKMAHMFDGCEYVDFGDLSGWDRSKVTDC